MYESILVVDDEEIITESYYKDLTHNKYVVETAADGEEAMAKLQRGNFNIVVTDIVMPKVDGLGVLREAKRVNSEIYVIMLTGYDDLALSIDALRLGADDYLLKPCETKELLVRIHRGLEKQERKRRLKLYEKILPVCMYCKSIRDDSSTEPGNGRWMVLEEFLHSKSGTAVSHTFCPKCEERARKEMLGD